MSSWSSWIKSQTSVLADGLRDFSDQLNEDTAEVRDEVSTKLNDANGKLSNAMKAVGESSTLTQLSELSSTGAARLSQRVDELSFDDMMRTVEGAILHAEHGTSRLLAQGAQTLRRATEESGAATSGGLGAAGAPAPAPTSSHRLEERVRALEADPSALLQPPSNMPAFERW